MTLIATLRPCNRAALTYETNNQHPQLLCKIPQVSSNRDHKARDRDGLGVLQHTRSDNANKSRTNIKRSVRETHREYVDAMTAAAGRIRASTYESGNAMIMCFLSFKVVASTSKMVRCGRSRTQARYILLR